MNHIRILSLILILSIQSAAQNGCIQAIERYTEVYLALPMPSADDTPEQKKAIKQMRRDIKTEWIKFIRKECGYKQGVWSRLFSWISFWR